MRSSNRKEFIIPARMLLRCRRGLHIKRWRDSAKRRFALLTSLLAAIVLFTATATVATHMYRGVPHDHPHAEGIHWSSENNLVQGYGDGTFGPNDGVTRGQLTTILQRQGAWGACLLADAGVRLDGDDRG